MSLGRAFDSAASPPQIQSVPGLPKKRPPPFCLRLAAEERARLTAEAGGAPLGAYLKAKLLGGSVPVRMRRSGLAVEDRQALGKVLALLGQSRLASNLNQLAHLANIGALPVSPEIEAEFHEAVSAVREMRRLLVTALGLKPEGER